MTTNTASSIRPHLGFGATIASTVALAALWVLVAIFRPGTTLHLGPVLVPLVPLLLVRGEEDHAVFSTLIAGAISVSVSFGLAVTGNLEGPAFSPFPNALVESLVGAAVGTVIGLVGLRSAR